MTTTDFSHELMRSSTISLALVLLIATSVFLIQPSMAPAVHDVTILDFSFNPEVRCIEKRDEIVWTNSDPVIYWLWFVFAENGSTYLLSDPIPPGESWSHNFTEPSQLLYYDLNRLWITGRLRVYAIFGDVDWDGDVDYDDLIVLAGAYGSSSGQPAYRSDADIDWDGDVDYDDLIVLAGNYGLIDP